eukprot:jgi/Psemu1/33889/gm1.33889_g
MLPPTAFDWNQIQDIAIQFGTFNAKDNAHKHEDLKQTFAHCLEYTDSLFITDDDAEGPKTLAPDPVTMLRKIVVNAIMDIIPSRERTAVNKSHISRLLADAIFWYVAPNQSTKRLRNKHSMDKAGELAIKNGQDTIFIKIRATHWGFKPDWDAIHFGEIYDTNIYSFPEATQDRYGKSNIRGATMIADKTADASSARFANLQQQKYIKPKAVPLQRTHINTTARIPPVTANLGPLPPVGPIANTPSVTAPRYIWTWTYSPTSELQQDKSLVTASSVTPSALTRFSHHPVPHYVPANFRWTFNPQKETVTFHCLPQPDTVPLKPPSQFPLSYATADDPPVLLRITKQHRDALKIKLYHIHANILSMNWFYDTID